MSEQPIPEPWHFDKKVPLALIFAILVQTIGAIWWAATVDARMSHAERQIATLTAADAANSTETRRISEALVRLDERIAAQNELLRRLEATLARMYPSR